MKKSIFLTLLMIFTVTATFSQRWKLRRYEASFGIGSTNIFGDVGGTADENNLYGLKDIRFGETRPSVHAGLRYKITQLMAVNLNINYGYGIGNDEGSRNNDRGYTFRTSIFEPSVQYEYYIIPEEKRTKSAAIFNRRGMINNYSKIGLYAFAGAGGAIFNPELEGAEARSAEETSGYSTFTIAFPIGLGLKYTIDDRWFVGFELGGRYTLTDWLDGFNPTVEANTARDIYYFSSVSAVYRIKTDRTGVPLFLRKINLNRKRIGK
ncbi:MAG: DUF6089 family protein [bacterium]